jgi:hypothetical protein
MNKSNFMAEKRYLLCIGMLRKMLELEIIHRSQRHNLHNSARHTL